MQTSTFIDNMQLPIHRWFRFPAGFSASWARGVISKFGQSKSYTVFDPFVGSGTTVLAGEQCFVKAIGIDAHPFLVKIANTKLRWRADIDSFRKSAIETLRCARSLPNGELSYPKLIYKCYSTESLHELDRLKRSWLQLHDQSPSSELIWLALLSILRHTSYVGTAPWTYVLPRKRKKKVIRPFEAFLNQVTTMIEDIQYFHMNFIDSPQGRISFDDARNCSTLDDNSVDLVITSPPYTNNYDYADALRLEMSFFGEIQKWSDLQLKVRRHLVRCCSQHMSEKDRLDVMLCDRTLGPITEELEKTCHDLKEERQCHGGKKKYDLMVAAYFSDLAKVWVALRRVCKASAKICFIIGDSAPYGVYIPVEKWLGELALFAGFESYSFEMLRNRNVKWKIGRKHRVPLHEGRLWVEG